MCVGGTKNGPGVPPSSPSWSWAVTAGLPSPGQRPPLWGATPSAPAHSIQGAGQLWPWGPSSVNTLPGELRRTVLEGILSIVQESLWDQVLVLGSSGAPSPSCSPRSQGHLPLRYLHRSPSLSVQFGQNQINTHTCRLFYAS